MEYLNGQTLTLLFLFGGVLVTVVGLVKVAFPSNIVAQRLTTGLERKMSVKRPPALRKNEDSVKLGWVGKMFAPKSAEKQSQLREKLIQAGYRNNSAVVALYTIRVLLGAGAFGLFAFLSPNLFHTDFYGTFSVAVGACVVAFMIPNFLLSKKIKVRQTKIRNGFPDALDMLLVCVEAGLGLDSALQKTTSEVETAHPILSEEFAIVCDEVRLGKSKVDALTSLVHRTTVEEVASLVTVITQAEQFGTGIADALRVFASEMRAKRLVRAEEKAHRMPVKLSLAVALITMPTMALFFIVPAIIGIIQNLSGIGSLGSY